MAEKVPLIEFVYNNSYHQSLGMSPFEALYWRKCRSPIYWHEAGERRFLGPEEVDGRFLGLEEVDVVLREI